LVTGVVSSSRPAAISAAPAVLVAPVSAPLVLLDVFGRVSDPRAWRGVRHRLPVLAAALAATLCGARSYAAMLHGPPTPTRASCINWG